MGLDTLLWEDAQLQSRVQLRHSLQEKQVFGPQNSYDQNEQVNVLAPSVTKKTHSLEALKKRFEFAKKRKRDQISQVLNAETDHEESVEWEDLRNETLEQRKIRYARTAVKKLFDCLGILADGGVTITTEQNIMVKAIWGSVLPQLCGDQGVYQELRSEIKRNYGLEWVSKGNNCFAGRRTGKSFAFSLAMACLAAVGLKLRLVFINLFSAAGNTNLTYMKQFLDKLRNDPLKRIRVGEIKQVDNYYLYVESHMQLFARDEQKQWPNKTGVDIPTSNMLASLPNMDAGGGAVRSLFSFFFAVQKKCRRRRKSLNTKKYCDGAFLFFWFFFVNKIPQGLLHSGRRRGFFFLLDQKKKNDERGAGLWRFGRSSGGHAVDGLDERAAVRVDGSSGIATIRHGNRV